MKHSSMFKALNLTDSNLGACTGMEAWREERNANILVSIDPATGDRLGSVAMAADSAYETVVEA